MKKLFVVLSIILVSGCADYRSSSNIKSEQLISGKSANSVKLLKSYPLNRSYERLGNVSVSIKKWTIFHDDPSKSQVDQALRKEGASIGADAIVNIVYKSGVGMTTWGFMDGSGSALKYTD